MTAEACCPPGSLGPVLTEIEPKGRMVTLTDKTGTRSDMECYQVGSAEPKRVIVVFPDVFGIHSSTHKQFCDVLADKLGNDTAVWLPDVFRGFPMAYNLGFLTFVAMIPILVVQLKTRLTVPKVDQDLKLLIQASIPDNCQVGVAGFCFGGWSVARALALEDGIFAAGVGMHPAWKPETMASGGGTYEQLAEKTGVKPILLLPAKQDDEMKASASVVQQMAERRGIKPEEIAVEFTDMDHGWVNRGDPTVPDVKQNQDKAIQMVVDFFEKHLQVK